MQTLVGWIEGNGFVADCNGFDCGDFDVGGFDVGEFGVGGCGGGGFCVPALTQRFIVRVCGGARCSGDYNEILKVQ